MLEETVIDELEQRGFTVFKVLKSTAECTKLIADDENSRYFVRCYPLKQIFRTPAERKVINNELSMAENFKKWNLNTCITYVKRIYTKTTLFMFYIYHRHVTLESYLMNQKINEQQMVLLLRDLLAIVYELRGAGVLHRHLSPDKIIVTGSQLKFCGVKYCTDVKKTKYDSDEYMYLMRHQTNFFCISPEVLLNVFTGFKTQIFNFGAIAYFMTHHCYPYSEVSIEHLKNLYKDGTSRPMIDLKYSEELVYVLQQTLKIGYSDRMALSELKLAIGGMYKNILLEEDDIRSKTYNILNPNIKIDDIPPSSKALKEQLWGSNSRGQQQSKVITLPAIMKKPIKAMPNLLLKVDRKVEDFFFSKEFESEHHSESIVNPASISEKNHNQSHLELLSRRSQKIHMRPISLGLKSVRVSHNGSIIS